MEQQVADAAMAMVRPTTDPEIRKQASHFLEQFTHSPEAWNIYARWLHSFRHQHQQQNGATPNDSDSIGLQILCLTLLQAKIRREIPRGGTTTTTTTMPIPNNDAITAIQQELWSLVIQPQVHNSVITPACICIAALAARLGIHDVITMCQNSLNVQSLQIIACIPEELEQTDIRSSEVTHELRSYLKIALDIIRVTLPKEDTILSSLQALCKWISHTNISISELVTEQLLQPLVHILSSSHPTTTQTYSSEIIIAASQALTEAIVVPTDNCTSTRQSAISTLLTSISQHGFVSAPFTYATQQGDDWEDCAHALATLICTFVTEEAEFLVTQPAEALLFLLLGIQSHPHTSIALTVMECWLTVQDIPIADRHSHWTKELYIKIVNEIISRIAYPTTFINWQNEIDVDESEFNELRRMVNDVLCSSYFLLRHEFVHLMVSAITTTTTDNWTICESGLFCLSSVSREVCARIKARALTTSISEDRQRTVSTLEHLCQALLTKSPTDMAAHPLVLGAVCNFVGAYAPVWNVQCSPEAILHLLAWLRGALSIMPVEAAKAVRGIFIQCSSKLITCDTVQLLKAERETMDAVLSINDDEAACIVAEGLTRVLNPMKEEPIVQEYLSTLVHPLLHHSEHVLKSIPVGQEATEESNLAVERLASILSVLQVIVKFSPPAINLTTLLWPILEATSLRTSQYEMLLDPLINIHYQMLRNNAEYVAPVLQQTINFVVSVFQVHKHTKALDYIAQVIEAFGTTSNDNMDSFKELLNHVSVIVLEYVSTEKRPHECPDIIRSYFEMIQRYVLYAPAAMISSQQYANVIGFAVDCLTSCRGERESTRSALIFLSQLFGWRLVRFCEASTLALQQLSGLVDEQLAQVGRVVTQKCVEGLLTGPTMLSPAYADCLFAIMHVTVTQHTENYPHENPPGHHHQNQNISTVAHQWMFAAYQTINFPHETYELVVTILIGLARNGLQSKPKAKMLLSDFVKISKGEMGKDALISYSLG